MGRTNLSASLSRSLGRTLSASQVEEELRNQYSLAYTPDRPGDDATYHLIHVTVNQKDLIVQAREGYYSGP